MKQKIIEAFNVLSVDYEYHVDEKSVYNSDYERPAMMRQIPTELENKHVLDAGCAAGWYSEQFINRGANVVAIDSSPNMIEAAKRRLGANATVLNMSLEEKLPFADATFDYIVSSLVLHYIKDWTFTFQQFKRILKPNGMLLYSVHHPFMDRRLSKSDDYFATELIVDKWKKGGKLVEVPFYRRPQQEIVNTTLKYFSLSELIEPQPTKSCYVKEPDQYEKLMKNPHFLIIKALNNK